MITANKPECQDQLPISPFVFQIRDHFIGQWPMLYGAIIPLYRLFSVLFRLLLETVA
jgi:hypothetical protein